MAASQLRRLGLSTQMALGQPPPAVAAALHRCPVDLIAVSVGSISGLAPAGDLITFLRTSLPALPPVVIGGAVAAAEDDIGLRTGADEVCHDAAEAARRCGLWPRVERARLAFRGAR